MKTKGRKQFTKEELNCKGCKSEFKEDEDVLGYDECEGWWHRECGEMSVADFKIINKIKSKNIRWVCQTCLVKPKEMSPDNIKLIIQEAMAEFNKKMEMNFEERIEKIVNEKVKSALEEMKDRERRKDCIIVTNIRESESETSEERLKEDMEGFLNHINKEIEVKREDVVEIVRLGKKIEGRQRPMKIKMKSKELKDKVIRCSYSLNKGKRADERVYLNEDLTAKERIKNKELRDEKKRRERNGERDLIIRNGEIVKRRAPEDQTSVKKV